MQKLKYSFIFYQHIQKTQIYIFNFKILFIKILISKSFMSNPQINKDKPTYIQNPALNKVTSLQSSFTHQNQKLNQQPKSDSLISIKPVVSYRRQLERVYQILNKHRKRRQQAYIAKRLTYGLYSKTRYQNQYLITDFNNFQHALRIAAFIHRRTQGLSLIIRLKQFSIKQYFKQPINEKYYQNNTYSKFQIKLTLNPTQEDLKQPGYNPPLLNFEEIKQTSENYYNRKLKQNKPKTNLYQPNIKKRISYNRQTKTNFKQQNYSVNFNIQYKKSTINQINQRNRKKQQIERKNQFIDCDDQGIFRKRNNQIVQTKKKDTKKRHKRYQDQETTQQKSRYVNSARQTRGNKSQRGRKRILKTKNQRTETLKNQNIQKRFNNQRVEVITRQRLDQYNEQYEKKSKITLFPKLLTTIENLTQDDQKINFLIIRLIQQMQDFTNKTEQKELDLKDKQQLQNIYYKIFISLLKKTASYLLEINQRQFSSLVLYSQLHPMIEKYQKFHEYFIENQTQERQTTWIKQIQQADILLQQINILYFRYYFKFQQIKPSKFNKYLNSYEFLYQNILQFNYCVLKNASSYLTKEDIMKIEKYSWYLDPQIFYTNIDLYKSQKQLFWMKLDQIRNKLSQLEIVQQMYRKQGNKQPVIVLKIKEIEEQLFALCFENIKQRQKNKSPCKLEKFYNSYYQDQIIFNMDIFKEIIIALKRQKEYENYLPKINSYRLVINQQCSQFQKRDLSNKYDNLFGFKVYEKDNSIQFMGGTEVKILLKGEKNRTYTNNNNNRYKQEYVPKDNQEKISQQNQIMQNQLCEIKKEIQNQIQFFRQKKDLQKFKQMFKESHSKLKKETSKKNISLECQREISLILIILLQYLGNKNMIKNFYSQIKQLNNQVKQILKNKVNLKKIKKQDKESHQGSQYSQNDQNEYNICIKNLIQTSKNIKKILETYQQFNLMQKTNQDYYLGLRLQLIIQQLKLAYGSTTIRQEGWKNIQKLESKFDSQKHNIPFCSVAQKKINLKYKDQIIDKLPKFRQLTFEDGQYKKYQKQFQQDLKLLSKSLNQANSFIFQKSSFTCIKQLFKLKYEQQYKKKFKIYQNQQREREKIQKIINQEFKIKQGTQPLITQFGARQELQYKKFQAVSYTFTSLQETQQKINSDFKTAQFLFERYQKLNKVQQYIFIKQKLKLNEKSFKIINIYKYSLKINQFKKLQDGELDEQQFRQFIKYIFITAKQFIKSNISLQIMKSYQFFKKINEKSKFYFDLLQFFMKKSIFLQTYQILFINQKVNPNQKDIFIDILYKMYKKYKKPQTPRNQTSININYENLIQRILNSDQDLIIIIQKLLGSQNMLDSHYFFFDYKICQDFILQFKQKLQQYITNKKYITKKNENQIVEDQMNTLKNIIDGERNKNYKSMKDQANQQKIFCILSKNYFAWFNYNKDIDQNYYLQNLQRIMIKGKGNEKRNQRQNKTQQQIKKQQQKLYFQSTSIPSLYNMFKNVACSHRKDNQQKKKFDNLDAIIKVHLNMLFNKDKQKCYDYDYLFWYGSHLPKFIQFTYYWYFQIKWPQNTEGRKAQQKQYKQCTIGRFKRFIFNKICFQRREDFISFMKLCKLQQKKHYKQLKPLAENKSEIKILPQFLQNCNGKYHKGKLVKFESAHKLTIQ